MSILTSTNRLVDANVVESLESIYEFGDELETRLKVDGLFGFLPFYYREIGMDG